jgi:hypothetical protein
MQLGGVGRGGPSGYDEEGRRGDERMRRLLSLGLLAVLTAGASASGQPAPALLETVSYADLGKLVRAQKGKVVIVYFWAHY